MFKKLSLRIGNLLQEDPYQYKRISRGGLWGTPFSDHKRN